MLTKDEATRIAAAVNAARPDWSIPSLMKVLEDERCRRRAYRDLFLAFIALALDPQSLKPTRIYVPDGHWWQVTRPAGEVSASAALRYSDTDDCDVCNFPKHADRPDHAYVRRDRRALVPAPSELLDRIHRLERTRTPKPETPKRPVDDILADHATQEEQQ